VTVTVLILTRDAGAAFRETLEMIAVQRPAADRLLVIDSGSEDDTVELARTHGAVVEAIAPQQFDFGITRDLGYERAETDLIANLSQDVVPRDETWLARLTAPFTDPRVAYVTARCAAREPEAMFLWQRLGRFYFTREMLRFRARYGVPCSNANSCVRRSAWAELRHGPIAIAEDLLLQKRLVETGHTTHVVDSATAWHQHSYTASQVFKRAWNEGQATRDLEIPYSLLDALGDCLRVDLWLTLARQIRYGRVRSAADLLYPWLRPVALWGGRRLGSGYWR